jgi:sialic acid synthase SpsE
MSHDDNVSIEIAGRKIGPLQPPYIVCELSADHKGSLERAIKMIEVAAETGADAIKIQTYLSSKRNCTNTLSARMAIAIRS